MSNARNLGEVGARLIQTGAVDLSASGNIKAATFQGSGRLLTDLLTMTGGNITIPFGPGSNYSNLAAALNSLSSLLFDDTANVVLQATEGTQSFSSTLNIDHPSSEKITIQGSYSPFQSTVSTNFSGSDTPVISVSGGFTSSTAPTTASSLSATFTYNSDFSIPATGQYILISGTSGRHAQYFTAGPYQTENLGGKMCFRIQMDTNGSSTGEAGRLFYTPGSKILANKFTTTGQISSKIFTVESTQLIVPPYYGASQIICAEAYDANFGNITDVTFCLANPQAYRGTTLTFNGSTITFSDATATNTYLNPGDTLMLLGQAVTVHTVAANNTCTVLDQLRVNEVPPLSGTRTSTTIPRPFFIKTHFEKYRGCHKVVSVDTATNQCTIETPIRLFVGGSQFPNPYGVAYPLPRFGVHSIGVAESVYPQGRLLKSVLDISNINTAIEGRFNSLSNLVFYCAPTSYNVSFNVGTQSPSTVTMQYCGFYGIGTKYAQPYFGNDQSFSLRLFVHENSSISGSYLGFGVRDGSFSFSYSSLNVIAVRAGGVGATRTSVSNFTGYDGASLGLGSGSVNVFVIGGCPMGFGYIDGTVVASGNADSRFAGGVVYGQAGYGYLVSLNESSISFSCIHSGERGLYINEGDCYSGYLHISNVNSIGVYATKNFRTSSTNTSIINCVYSIQLNGSIGTMNHPTYGFGRGGSIGGFFALSTNGIYVINTPQTTLNLVDCIFRNNDQALYLENSSSTNLVGRITGVSQTFNTAFLAGGIVAGATTGFTTAPATGNFVRIT